MRSYLKRFGLIGVFVPLLFFLGIAAILVESHVSVVGITTPTQSILSVEFTMESGQPLLHWELESRWLIEHMWVVHVFLLLLFLVIQLLLCLLVYALFLICRRAMR